MSVKKAYIRSLMAHHIRRRIFPAMRGLWTLGFMCVGRTLRPEAPLSVADGRQRVLVVAPHPDDETLGCGGAIALHHRAGDRVCVLVVTDGGSSRAGGLDRKAMILQRRTEARAAVSKLMPLDTIPSAQAEPLCLLDMPEGSWLPADVHRPLLEILRQFKPTLVYTTSCVDFHPEHLKVAHAVAYALRNAQENTCRAVRVYELQVPLTPLLANTLIDITPVVDQKLQALRQYKSQLASFLWVPRNSRYLRTLYRSSRALEVFWELEPEQFCRLMSLCGQVTPRFRSIRMRPTRDPLAWIVGLSARQKLKEIALSNVLH